MLPSMHSQWLHFRGLLADTASQLLPGQEDRLRLPRSEGDPGLQDPRHLGQGHPAARYIPALNLSQNKTSQLT